MSRSDRESPRKQRDFVLKTGFDLNTFNVSGIDIPGINAALIAHGYGMNAREAERPEDLGALRHAFDSREPTTDP